jgi:cytochrome c556
MTIRNLSVIAALAALTACAPEAKGPGAEAAHARHEHFEDLGRTFRVLNDQAKKSAPDAAAMAAAAAKVDDLAKDLPNWFPAGSGPQDGVKTHAKAEVWTNAAGFAEQAQLLQEQTARLRAAAPRGVAAMKPLIADVGARCGSCHKQYRERN